MVSVIHPKHFSLIFQLYVLWEHETPSFKTRDAFTHTYIHTLTLTHLYTVSQANQLRATSENDVFVQLGVFFSTFIHLENAPVIATKWFFSPK